MNARARQLLDEVMHLPTDEREALAAELLQKLDGPPDARTDAEWADEISRRAQEVMSPGWKGRSWDDVRQAVERTRRDSRDE